MRVAIWGKLTHSVAVHHRCRETCMSHFMGRHQLMSTHKDAKYTSTGTCAYINARVGVMLCGVKTVCTHTLTYKHTRAQYNHAHMPRHTRMHTSTHYHSATAIFACLYGGLLPAGIEWIDRTGQVSEAGIGEKKSN